MWTHCEAIFARIITLELFEPLYTAACEKFRGDPGIELHHGDSASLLPGIIPNITSPIVFWLDAHYSGGGTGGENICPVLGEVDAVFTRNNPDDIILIDDARLFGWSPGYPSKKKSTPWLQPADPRGNETEETSS